jgi:FHA domain-containing protein/zinc ribbon protein
MEQDTPPILRWHPKPAVDAAAATLVARAQAGLLGQLDLAWAMLSFCFRDPGGTYRFLDVPAGLWYRFDGTDWQPAAEVPGMLEGPDALPVDLALPPETDPPSPPPSAAPSTVLAEAIQALRAAYAGGQINSLVAEALLGQRFLVDDQGRAWTVGVQSGQWYAFAQGAWAPAAAPPDPSTLARIRPPSGPCPGCGQQIAGAGACPHCGTAVPPVLEGVSDEGYGPILEFLQYAGTLPEAVTAPWAPPPGYPNVELPAVSRRGPLVAPAPTPQAAPAAGGPRWFLQAVSGPLANQPIELGDRLRIGRADDNDLPLPNPGVSRYHATLTRDADGGYTIADQGSANGTAVNGRRIAEPTRLQPGDRIAVSGDARFTIAVRKPPAISSDREAPPLGGSASLQGCCATCGTPVRPGVKFCPQCGTRLV